MAVLPSCCMAAPVVADSLGGSGGTAGVGWPSRPTLVKRRSGIGTRQGSRAGSAIRKMLEAAVMAAQRLEGDVAGARFSRRGRTAIACAMRRLLRAQRQVGSRVERLALSRAAQPAGKSRVSRASVFSEFDPGEREGRASICGW